jgi:hypothetical protein
MEPEVDARRRAHGPLRDAELDSDDATATSELCEGVSEIRAIEKALGIDKVSRESGGQHTVDNYLRTLKKTPRMSAASTSRKRVLAYEAFVNGLRLATPRPTQRRRRGPRLPRPDAREAPGVVRRTSWRRWSRSDKKFAREKGKIFVGKL